MNKIKAALITMFVVGSSSVAMASPATFSARGSLSFGSSRPAPAPIVVRDHRFDERFDHDQRVDYRYDQRFDQRFDQDHRVDYRYDSRVNRRAFLTLSGSYTSEFGPVQLYQYGDRITGTFTAGGGGTIEGRIVGNQIVFHWKNSAERGHGVWQVSARNRIEGTWGKNHSEYDGGAWNLMRL